MLKNSRHKYLAKIVNSVSDSVVHRGPETDGCSWQILVGSGGVHVFLVDNICREFADIVRVVGLGFAGQSVPIVRAGQSFISQRSES